MNTKLARAALVLAVLGAVTWAVPTFAGEGENGVETSEMTQNTERNCEWRSLPKKERVAREWRSLPRGERVARERRGLRPEILGG